MLKEAIKILLFITITAALTACVHPEPHQLMPPLQYSKPISLHTNKNAVLVWKSGQQLSSEIPSHIPYGSGIIEVMVAKTINDHQRKTHPSDYNFTYGSAQQTIFMTSLRDTLTQNNVFNKVDLTAESKPHPKDVMITVDFKTSRVADASELYKIILSAEVTVEEPGKKAFKRNYLIQSEQVNAYKSSFKNNQISVSQQLLDKIISGLEQWQKEV